MRGIVALFAAFPWWAAVLILGGLALFVGWYVRWKFNRIIRESILEIGSGMKESAVEVHAVASVDRPKGPSPYDLSEDDEEFAPELDGTEWDEEGVNFYSIDATITPADPEAKWDPTGLAVVPADWIPDDPTDVCERMGGLHSAEIWENGRFVPLAEGERTGSCRCRFLFGIPEDVRAVKFAVLVSYFGRVELPAPAPKPAPAR